MNSRKQYVSGAVEPLLLKTIWDWLKYIKYTDQHEYCSNENPLKVKVTHK